MLHLQNDTQKNGGDGPFICGRGRVKHGLFEDNGMRGTLR